MTDVKKYLKYIQIGIREEGIASLLMMVVAYIIYLLGSIIKLPPYITLLAVTIVFIGGVIWGYKQAEKSESKKAIKTLKFGLKDFREKFLNRGESNSFFSLSYKKPPKEEYPIGLWDNYHNCRFMYLKLRIDHIDERITGLINKQETISCFRDLFTTTNKCREFLNEYVKEINEQGNLTEEHKKIVDVSNKFKEALLEDVRSLNIDEDVGVQLEEIIL